MAVVKDSVDPMRDLIAQSVEENLGVDPNADAALEGDDDAAGAKGADGDDAGAGGDAAGDAAGDAGGDGRVADGETAGERKPASGDVAEASKDASVVGDKPAAGDAVDKAKKEDPFAKEHGVAATDKLGRPNRIPYPVVRDRIVPNAVKKERAKWDAEVLKPAADKNKVYEDRLGVIGETEKIMFEQPRRYLSMLATIPGYTQLFDELRGGKAVTEGEKAAKPGDGTVLADANDPEPQPDAKDEHGKVIGWTQEGLSTLRAWDRRQAAREGAKAATDALEKRFKPLLSREEAVQQNQQLATTIDDVITGAAAWPGFQENHAAILTELAKGKDSLETGPKMHRALQDAYNTVMFGAVTKVKETEEEARARYFEEFQTSLRKAPRTTSTGTTVRRNEPAPEGDEHASSDDRTRSLIAASVRAAGLK